MLRKFAAIAALLLFVGLPVGEFAGLQEWARVDIPIGWIVAIVAILSILLAVSYRGDSAFEQRDRER